MKKPIRDHRGNIVGYIKVEEPEIKKVKIEKPKLIIKKK